jgi:DNA-binding SARP family transcriptional activator
MSRIRLYLFGTPTLEIAGQAVAVNRRKALALVAYLALTERVQSRATVATLLWPDLDEAGARKALRSTLPLLTRLSDSPSLIIDHASLALNRDLVWSDVGAFLAALGRTRLHVHGRGMLCDECVFALEEAVGLYRDDFLSGFSLTDSLEFDDWQIAKQEWLKREYTTALRRLAEHFSEPNLERAISHARRWLEVDPLSESAHRLLMNLYVANGQRTEALRQYQNCAQILDQELATPPEDETTRLYEAIRSGTTPVVVKTERQTATLTVCVMPSLPPLLVGREAVLSDLKTRLGIPNERTKQAATVIEGWPGVGKSTTVAALAHDHEVGLAFPDGVLWTSLGEAPNLLGALTVWGEALRLIPPNKMLRLEELTSQLTAVLRSKRMLLIIDDVWDVEHAAPFRVGGQNCGLVMSSRLTEVARKLSPTAADVYRLPVLADDAALSLLSRLAPEAVRAYPKAALELVHDLEGLPLAIQVAGRLLYEEMQLGWGIDHLVTELRAGAALLMAQPPSDVATVASDTSPSVAALLQRSTKTLDEETLVRFALLGFFVPKPATFDLAAMATAWNVDDPRPTVRILVNRGLLEPMSGGRFQMHALLVLHAKSLLESAV